MVDNWSANFSTPMLRHVRVILGGGPATRSALGATGAPLKEIQWQIHR
jgi:hypothetical protein